MDTDNRGTFWKINCWNILWKTFQKKKKKSNRDAAKKVIKKKGNKLEFKWRRNGLIKNKNEPLSRIK